jgi:hypothetical protein
MKNIDSIRTATRWSFSDSHRGAARCCTIALFALSALTSAACTRSSTYYVPTPGEERLSQDEFRDESDQVLSVECPRLMGTSGYASGEARARIQVDRSGAVQKVEFTRPSADERINTVWGALAARLKFDPQEGQTDELRTSMMTIGYSCGKGTALTTLQL